MLERGEHSHRSELRGGRRREPVGVARRHEQPRSLPLDNLERPAFRRIAELRDRRRRDLADEVLVLPARDRRGACGGIGPIERARLEDRAVPEGVVRGDDAADALWERFDVAGATRVRMVRPLDRRDRLATRVEVRIVGPGETGLAGSSIAGTVSRTSRIRPADT